MDWGLNICMLVMFLGLCPIIKTLFSCSEICFYLSLDFQRVYCLSLCLLKLRNKVVFVSILTFFLCAWFVGGIDGACLCYDFSLGKFADLC